MIKATKIINIVEKIELFDNSYEQFSLVLSQWKKKLAPLGFDSRINDRNELKAEARIPLTATEYMFVKQSNKILKRYIKELSKYFGKNADAQFFPRVFPPAKIYVMNPASLNHDIEFEFYYSHNNTLKESYIGVFLNVSFMWSREKQKYLKAHEDEIEEATAEYCNWMIKMLENTVKAFRLVTPEE